MDRKKRDAQQAREIEENQVAMRKSVAQTKRHVDDADDMLRRHRVERDYDDNAAKPDSAK